MYWINEHLFVHHFCVIMNVQGIKEMESSILILVLIFGSLSEAIESSVGLQTDEVCRDNHFTASCKHGEVLLIESALYGRVRRGNCAAENAPGCSIDAKDYLASRCSGKQSCDVFVTRSGDYFKDQKPCPEDYSWHLYLSYQCTPVHTSREETCITQSYDVISDDTGYLSSHVARNSKYGAGTERCPWRIQVKSGQMIQLSVYNFMMRGNSCHKITAMVLEKFKVTPIKLCPMETTASVAFTSTGNSIDVYFINLHGKPTVDYLLKFKAVGCPDMPAIPHGSHVERSGNSLAVRCNATGKTWLLTCSETKWKGLLGNCTVPNSAQGWGIFDGGEFPYGIVIVVAVGVALGILFGGTTLLFISYRMKRNGHRYEKPPDPCWNYEAGTMRRNSGSKVTTESAYTGTAPTRKQWSQGGHNAANLQEYNTNHNAPMQDTTAGKTGTGNNSRKVLIMADNKIIDYTPSSPHLYESPQADNAVDAFYG